MENLTQSVTFGVLNKGISQDWQPVRRNNFINNMVDIGTIVPGVECGNYFITIYGMVWSNYTSRFRVSAKCTNGYLEIITNDGIHLLIHRLVMMAFKPVPNMENLVVNHIDGDKTNNCISNLEWVTEVENNKHARITGLMNQNGEQSVLSKTTDCTVHKVCKLLEQNIDRRHILNMFENDGITYNMINNISNGHNWKHISYHYNIPNVIKINEDKLHMIYNQLIKQPINIQVYRQIVRDILKIDFCKNINYRLDDIARGRRNIDIYSLYKDRLIFETDCNICNEYIE